MNALDQLTIVIPMLIALTLMDHSYVLVAVDILETEQLVKVS